MSTLARWDPFGEVTTLRDAMGQLFEQAFLRPGYGAATTPIAQMNVVEANGQYECQIMAPGAQSDDIDLTVRQNTLTLQVKTKETFGADTLKSATFLLHEFGPGEYTRSITFPKDVDGNKVGARYDRGILYVTVPLAAHAHPKRIAIQEAPNSQPIERMIEEKAPTREPAQVN
jgi:HSP20 family protein